MGFVTYLGPDGVVWICSAVVLVLIGQFLLVKTLRAVMILHKGYWRCKRHSILKQV